MLTTNAWLSPACSPPGTIASTNLMCYWTNIYQISIRRRGSSAVLSRTSNFAIIPSVMECQRTERRWVCQFSFTIRCPFSDRKRKFGFIMATHIMYVYLFWKFGEDRSSIIVWDNNWSAMGQLKSSIGQCSARQTRAGRSNQYSVASLQAVWCTWTKCDKI